MLLHFRVDFSSNFMTLLVSIFASIFSSIFDGKWPLKWSGESPAGRPFFHLFRDLVFYVDFMLNLAHFCFPFGALWLTLGSLLLTLGSLLAHFWCPLAHFWCPFLHFCSPRDPFSHFCCILSSFFVSFWIFHENIVQNLILKSFSVKITFSVNQIVFSRSASNAPQQKVHLLF